MIDAKLERILLRVQKPARYTGGEYNEIIKDKATVDVRFAMCFPDTYEIGMSNLGLRILYGSMNEAGRRLVRARLRPLGGHGGGDAQGGHPSLRPGERRQPSQEFDFVGFSLGYEMAYTNVLNMLDLAHIPLHSDQRGEEDPIIVAGGTCVYNRGAVGGFHRHLLPGRRGGRNAGDDRPVPEGETGRMEPGGVPAARRPGARSVRALACMR